MNNFDRWFEKFYYSEKAQEFCFGNHNNATRDEQIGEFSAGAAWDYQQLDIDGFRDEITAQNTRQLIGDEQYELKIEKLKKEMFDFRIVCDSESDRDTQEIEKLKKLIGNLKIENGNLKSEIAFMQKHLAD